MIDTTQSWRHFPKVELHTHIDCSLSYYAARNISGTLRLRDYLENFVAPGQCENLADYLSCIDPAIALLQSKTALTIATDDLADQLAAENVRYAEIRFAPLLHTSNRLPANAVVETVIEAMLNAEAHYGVRLRLILCTLRHYVEAQSNEVADLVCRYADHGVVALDLAADEAGFPIDAHINAFQKVNSAGLNTIAHAGEARGADSVSECVRDLNVSRIGHGVRSVEDEATIEMLLEKNVHLEICPTSNIHTNIFADYSEHSICKLKDLGVSIGVNTDARTISDVSLSSEYAVLEQAFDWGRREFHAANVSAMNASFAPLDLKTEILAELSAEYDQKV